MSLNTGHPEVQTPYVPERIQGSNDLHLPGARDDAEHLLREWLVDVFGLTGYGDGGEHYSPNGSDLGQDRSRSLRRLQGRARGPLRGVHVAVFLG